MRVKSFQKSRTQLVTEKEYTWKKRGNETPNGTLIPTNGEAFESVFRGAFEVGESSSNSCIQINLGATSTAYNVWISCADRRGAASASASASASALVLTSASSSAVRRRTLLFMRFVWAMTEWERRMWICQPPPFKPASWQIVWLCITLNKFLPQKTALAHRKKN